MTSRWKLHLPPNLYLASYIDKDNELPPLPAGKSAIDVLADFTKYLFQCAKTYIQTHHPAFLWSYSEDAIQYTFTHPSGWEGVQQQLYQQAVERAGLVPSTPEGRSRVHILSDGEANLHFCIANLSEVKTPAQAGPQGVVIIDAGGVTIDLNMFSVTSNPISYEEIAPPECMQLSLTAEFLVVHFPRLQVDCRARSLSLVGLSSCWKVGDLLFLRCQ